jgi:hypothetical protein
MDGGANVQKTTLSEEDAVKLTQHDRISVKVDTFDILLS